jgi:hypothetical protein
MNEFNVNYGCGITVIVPMCAYFTSLKGKPTGIEFIDSTTLKVCHNIRIPRHKTFEGVAQRGKGTMGWFYGFKLHLIVNYKGEIVAAKVTTGNVHDNKPVEELAKGLTDKLYGDKGYLNRSRVNLIISIRCSLKKVSLRFLCWTKKTPKNITLGLLYYSNLHSYINNDITCLCAVQILIEVNNKVSNYTTT